MPRHRRSNPYNFRDSQIDPLFTYDGIKTNPLSYINSDIIPLDSNCLCLAELYHEHWTINLITEEIFLHDPFIFSTNDDDNIILKSKTHPLKWLYDLIKSEQLHIYYSSKQCTLTIVYLLNSSKPNKNHFNLFAFYTYCKENNKTNGFFKHLFTFDDYQSILHLNDGDNYANNIIDFIYQEIQANTMVNIDDSANSSLLESERFLRNDVIQLKHHQIKSSKHTF